MPSPQRAIVLGLLLLCGGSARGEVYKCTDAAGAVQFTDHPCTGVSTYNGRKAAAPEEQGADEHLQKTQRLLDALQQEREQAEQEKAQQKAAAEKRQHECVSARDYLRNITQASSIYRLDEQGNRVVLSDEERSRATDDAHARVAKWCN
jgi:vacuolar-type H+-ATPase subunit I/STV1